MASRKNITDEEFRVAYYNPDNIHILKSVSCRYTQQLSEHELIECSDTALWRCLQYYDPTYGQKFTTSLTRFMYWECNRALKKKRNMVQTISLFDNTQLASLAKENDISDMVENLEEDERHLIQQRYYEDMTFQQIGNLNGYSKEIARKKIEMAISRLKGMCGV